MQDIYKNIEEHNLYRECNESIVIDDVIADMISNKELDRIVTDLFIRRRKQISKYLNISCFYHIILFSVPK